MVHIHPPHDAPKGTMVFSFCPWLILTYSGIVQDSKTSLYEVWSPNPKDDDAPSLLKESFERHLSRVSESAAPEVLSIDLD